jgi:hypothetical protein
VSKVIEIFYREGTDPSHIANDYGLAERNHFGHINVAFFEAPDFQSLAQIVAQLTEDPRVKSAKAEVVRARVRPH